jgi:hypothetical protein
MMTFCNEISPEKYLVILTEVLIYALREISNLISNRHGMECLSQRHQRNETLGNNRLVVYQTDDSVDISLLLQPQQG